MFDSSVVNVPDILFRHHANSRVLDFKYNTLQITWATENLQLYEDHTSTGSVSVTNTLHVNACVCVCVFLYRFFSIHIILSTIVKHSSTSSVSVINKENDKNTMTFLREIRVHTHLFRTKYRVHYSEILYHVISLYYLYRVIEISNNWIVLM